MGRNVTSSIDMLTSTKVLSALAGVVIGGVIS